MEKEFTFIIDLDFVCGHLHANERIINVEEGKTKEELSKKKEYAFFRVQSLTYHYDDEKVDVKDVEAIAKTGVYEEASDFMKNLQKNAKDFISTWDNYKSDRNVHFNCAASCRVEYNKVAYTKK